MRRILTVVFMIAALAPPVTAQSKAGTLLGTVRDELKALIPGVQITLTEAESKTTYKVTSNESSEYEVKVAPGIYSITAELPGFIAVKVSDVRIKENESTKLDPMTLTVDRNATTSRPSVSRDVIPIPLAPVTNQPPKRL